MATTPSIAVFGASGLIGEAVSSALITQGFVVTPIARRFTASQRATFGPKAVERAIIAYDTAALSHLLSELEINIVVNCIGVLRDGHRGQTIDVHEGFAQRLLAALATRGDSPLLIQISIPGQAADDTTPFSRSKRAAESAIAAAAVASVVLRPGFVIAPAAYGGSALMRALAMTPFDFPQKEASRPFMITAAGDITQTIAFVAQRWRNGQRDWNCIWDVMAPSPSSVDDILKAFRTHFGGPRGQFTVPPGAMAFGAILGDLVSLLGWSPPIGRTSLAEIRRGIEGNPQAWMAATGIQPETLDAALQRVPATVQEKWFGRLYFLKPAIIAILVVFWCLSGLIALTAAFDSATAILTAHGFPLLLGRAVTIISSLVDITVGMAIALRKTCRIGLMASVAVSLFYMIGAVFITPDLWLEPLGALVKTLPSIVLSLVALATLEDR